MFNGERMMNCRKRKARLRPSPEPRLPLMVNSINVRPDIPANGAAAGRSIIAGLAGGLSRLAIWLSSSAIRRLSRSIFVDRNQVRSTALHTSIGMDLRFDSVFRKRVPICGRVYIDPWLNNGGSLKNVQKNAESR
jgi:hypothetical protein